MDNYPDRKVIGAFLIGFAMVAGAYVVSDYEQPPAKAPAPLAVVAEEAPNRVFIAVSDSDGDGVEDWRDQFVTAPAVNLSAVAASDYIPPKTLTGKLGVSLMEGLLMSKVAGPAVRSKETVIADNVKILEKTATADKIYDVRDIIVAKDNSSSSIRLYGNGMADILLTQSVPGLEHELLLLKKYQESPEPKDPKDLATKAQVYKNYRDHSLKTPVPSIFIKEHLDLINVYNALYIDIDAMTKAESDPMVPFLRLKRYRDDAEGLTLAFSNIYDRLVDYAVVFEPNDSAVIFAAPYQASP